jgi:hypothetical protein
MVLVVAAAAVVLTRMGLGLANAIGGERSVYDWFTGTAYLESRKVLARIGLAPERPFGAWKAHV